jgi:serine/threonine protein kinase
VLYHIPCCILTVKLYRCYDNRLRPTERRPDLYETGDTDLFGECHVILENADTTNEAVLHPFGQLQLPGDIEPINWLWAYRGQIKIIATLFHVGIHYATLPKHYLPIVQHLEELHRKRYVHGDIRAYNMVLKYDNGSSQENFGRLIDFDYGGLVPVASAENQVVQYPKYPSGYVDQLNDGVRPGRPGGDITFEDDWRALGSVILELYALIPGPTRDDNDEAVQMKRERQLFRMREAFLFRDEFSFVDRMREAFTALGEECEYSPNNPGPFLQKYLNLAQDNGFVMRRTTDFEGDLRDNNMMESGDPRNDSKGATGSPPRHN